MIKNDKKISVTVLLPAGRLPLEIMLEAHRLAEKYCLGIYLSTMQNLRFTDVPESVVEELKNVLIALGAEFKGPGKFPIPRICVGKDHCNLGLIDTEQLSQRVLNRFGSREHTKAKFKIAIAGCTMCCSGAKTTDIGIMASRDGFEMYVGGKGGPFPKIGRRIARKIDEEKVLQIIEQLVEFHDKHTEKKQRMAKSLDIDGFPFVAV